MATHFQIIKGLSTSFFNSDGSITEKLNKHKYENCWYLATDTAEVYVCVRENPNDPESLVLKKINHMNDISDSESISDLRESLGALTLKVDDLISSSNIIDGGEIE